MAFVKLTFMKYGALWRSQKKDSRGKACWNGKVTQGVELKDGDKIFLYQTQRRSDKAPELEVFVGRPAVAPKEDDLENELDKPMDQPPVYEPEVADEIKDEDIPF
jgi:hypothetical protein